MGTLLQGSGIGFLCRRPPDFKSFKSITLSFKSNHNDHLAACLYPPLGSCTTGFSVDFLVLWVSVFSLFEFYYWQCPKMFIWMLYVVTGLSSVLLAQLIYTWSICMYCQFDLVLCIDGVFVWTSSYLSMLLKDVNWISATQH